MLKKIGYIIVALLFGTLGIHNFFEGNYTSGFAKLIISVCAGCLVSGYVLYVISSLMGLWILFDILQYCLYGKSYNIKKLFK